MRHLWWVLGAVLVGVGLAVALSSSPGQTDYGWFAYAPSTDDILSGGSVWVVSRAQVAGLAVAVVGLVTVAAGAGFRLGRRR